MDTDDSETPAPHAAAAQPTPVDLRQAVAEEFNQLVESGLERSVAAAQAPLAGRRVRPAHCRRLLLSMRARARSSFAIARGL